MNLKNLKRIVFGLALVGLFGLSSCEKKEFAKVVGFIQGHVFDGNTNEALDGVKVQWMVAGNKDTTNATAADGYIIRDLPSGDYSIWFSKAGYTTVVFETGVPLTISEDAVRGGTNIEYVTTYDPNLYSLDATITGRVYKTENGMDIPAVGATVLLDYNSLTQEDDEHYRFVPGLYTVVTDANGYYTFTNVPATSANLVVNDFTDSNGEVYYDSYYSHTTSYRTIYLSSGSSVKYNNISLTRVTDGIKLINTNAWISTNVSTNMFDVTSNIELTFNKAIDQAVTLDKGFVTLTKAGVDIEVAVTFADGVITIDPTQDLEPNTTYSVNYSVYSSQQYDVTTSNVVFTTLDNATVPAQVTGFVLNMGNNWTADYNTTSVSFEFNTIANATSYEIYAADNLNNTEFVYVGTVGQDDDYVNPMQFITADLSTVSTFDYYNDDPAQTPFSHGTQVSFKVRAKNSAGVGPFSDVINVTDETAFDAGDMNFVDAQYDNTGASISANNTGGTSSITVNLDFDISSSRYANTATAPSIGIYNTGTLVTTDISFTWTDHRNGVATFTVPAGSNYVGYEIRLSGVEDSSGNIQDATDYEPETLN